MAVSAEREMGKTAPQAMTIPSFAISARWRNRRPTTQEMARRFDAMIEALRPIHEKFRKGWVWVQDDGVPYENIRDDLASAIALGKAMDDRGRPWADGGYRFIVVNKRDEVNPPSLEISFNDGCLVPGFWWNVVAIGTRYGVVPDPTFVTYDVIRATMLIACETFEADSSRAYPFPLTKLDEPGACKIGWMTYIGPEPAPLITPPPNAIVEHRPNGGLFMAATRDSFDVDDPAHVAAARDIVAAVSPYNAWAVAMGYR